jgi:hypothetical protein
MMTIAVFNAVLIFPSQMDALLCLPVVCWHLHSSVQTMQRRHTAARNLKCCGASFRCTLLNSCHKCLLTCPLSCRISTDK